MRWTYLVLSIATISLLGLAGWSESGERPEFDVVTGISTGISTGSLIAPIAFLGSSHDETLHTYYKITEDDVVLRLGLFGILKQKTALTKSQPLVDLIETVLGQEELDLIAIEHRKGRRLLIATTHLDSKRGVIWDIGKIANSGHTNSLRLARKVMLASSSIPVAFPPVMIDVEVNGERYDEMHVDGGVITQAFGSAIIFVLNKDESKRTPYRYYLIRNGVFEPDYQPPKMSMLSIAGESLNTVIRTMGVADLVRAYSMTKGYGGEFYYTSIPVSFDEEPSESFDPVYMKALFDVGYEFGKSAVEWPSTPPIVGSYFLELGQQP